MASLLDWRVRVRDKKGDALSEISEQKAVFADAVMAANAAETTYNQTQIASILAQFNQLESELERAKTRSQIELLVKQAYTLSRLRAYVCPPGVIALSGQVALDTMEEWSVPSSALESLNKNTKPLLSNVNDLNAARSALNILLEEYDSWDDYIDEYNRDMRNITYVLALLFLVSLVGVMWSIRSDFMVLGLLLAGACGALVSVVSKVPTLNVYGDSAPYIRGIWKRVCMGLAASMIGAGFLASGLVAVTLPKAGSLHDMIQVCLRPPASHDGAAKTGGPPEPSQVTPVKPGEGGDCETRDKVILVALVMLFGFSERALTSFEERVFPSKP